MRRFLGLLNAALLIAMAGYTFYAAGTDSGLYRWFVERQTAWFGGHDQGETIVMMLAAGGIAVAVIAVIGARFVPRGPAAPLVSPASGRLLMLLVGLAFTAGAVVLGRMAWQRAEAPAVYAPFDLGKHEVPRGPYVELLGVAHEDMTIGVRDGEILTRYVPFTAPDWQPDQPVTYFLVNGADAPPPTPAPFGQERPREVEVHRSGALLEDQLPSVARAGFEKHGVKLATPVFVLDATPGAMAVRAGLAALVCGALALAFLLSFVTLAVRARGLARQAGSTRAA